MENHKDIGILGFNLILPSGRSQQYPDKIVPLEVGEVSFAAVIIRAEVFHIVGHLDPDYVLGYAEDTDFCYRTRRRGFKIVYVPQVRILHVRQATFRRVPQVVFTIGSRNSFRHFILNKSLAEWFKWIVMAFIGIESGRIVVRNDVKRLKWLTYGLIVYVKWYGLKGLIKLIVESIRRRF